jgi:hypothetical protein
METVLSIFIGVISGIITSLLLFILAQIVRKILVPWYSEFVYKGIDVSGTWRGVIENEKFKILLVVNLEQSSFDVVGALFAETLYKDNPEKNYSNQYSLKGFIKNHITTLNYEAMAKNRTGVGTMMFKSQQGGTNLFGHLIHSEDVDGAWVTDCLLYTSDAADDM